MVRKKIPWKQIAGLLLIMALGVAFGFFVASQAEAIGLKGASTDRLISYLALLLLALCHFLQIVIHEAGHLIFGLLSGYRFLLPGGQPDVGQNGAGCAFAGCPSPAPGASA